MIILLISVTCALVMQKDVDVVKTFKIYHHHLFLEGNSFLIWQNVQLQQITFSKVKVTVTGHKTRNNSIIHSLIANKIHTNV